ncbi:MAG: hypothetical protein ABIM31_01055 [candidate division WOR-3 bacterium]
MIILLILLTRPVFWGATFGIISPTGKTSEIIKSGGFIEGEIAIPVKSILFAGIEFSTTSLVMKGTGNSTFKILSLNPALFIIPQPVARGIELESKLLLSRFVHDNPSNSFVFYGLGYAYGASIKVASHPLKISISLDYNTFPSRKNNFSWIDLGIKIGK